MNKASIWFNLKYITLFYKTIYFENGRKEKQADCIFRMYFIFLKYFQSRISLRSNRNQTNFTWVRSGSSNLVSSNGLKLKGKGSTIDYNRALGGGGQGFCDDITKAFVLNRVTMADVKMFQITLCHFLDDPLNSV